MFDPYLEPDYYLRNLWPKPMCGVFFSGRPPVTESLEKVAAEFSSELPRKQVAITTRRPLEMLPDNAQQLRVGQNA